LFKERVEPLILETYNKNNIALIGNSVGEITSLLCAGVFNVDTALKILEKRGNLMKKAFKDVECTLINCL
jgi:malonyl CoA-acyl carrier protein transacylase